jgi:hypothetical protein
MCLNETYSKVLTGKHLSDSFPTQNCLKQGDALEYAIRKVQENQVRLKLNGTHQIVAYDHDVNLLGDNIRIINKNSKTLPDASKKVGLEIYVKKTKHMLLSPHHNSGQNRFIQLANEIVCFRVQYFGTTITNQNLNQEEIKKRLNSGNDCYHSVQKLLSSRLLSNNLNIEIYKTIILPVVRYGCET